MTQAKNQAQVMLQKVKQLQNNFRSRRKQTKELRRVPDTSIQELQDIGFFLALQPKAYGGFEMTPQAFFTMHIEIAKGCMSTAWAAGIVAVHAFQIALMDKQAQEDVWGSDIHARVSSSYAPMAKVKKVDGGFEISGRWGWSSGSNHCTWALLGGIVPDEGYRTFLVPDSDYTIIDTWHSMGLQGTGSNDIEIKTAFVPEHRTHKQLDGFNLTNPGVDAHSAAIYHLPWAQIFARTVCTPAIGACKEALDIYKNTVSQKMSMDVSKHSNDTSVLERISKAETIIDEMEVLLFRNFDQMMQAIEQGQEIAIAQRAKYRYQASLVIEKSLEVIDSLFSAAGGRSVFAGSEIQQLFLDMHTARAHVANNPTNFARNLGGLHLGLENGDFFI